MEITRFQEMAAILPYQMHPMGGSTVYTVEVRHIQRFLNSRANPTTYAKEQNERGAFIENKDFIVFSFQGKNPGGGRPRIEYHYTFDAAKKICMMSETDKGDDVREYFLECERRAQSIQPPTLDQHIVDQIITMFRESAQASQSIRLELDTKITAEEAREIAKEEIQEALKHQSPEEGISAHKMTLLKYLERAGMMHFAPQSWQQWIRYYDIAGLIEPAELLHKPGRRWPLRFYSPTTHEKAFDQYCRETLKVSETV